MQGPSDTMLYERFSYAFFLNANWLDKLYRNIEIYLEDDCTGNVGHVDYSRKQKIARMHFLLNDSRVY